MSVAIATLTDGRLHTFSVDDSNNLYAQWQVSGHPTDWSLSTAFIPNPGPVTSVAVTKAADGGLAVVVQKTDGTFAVSHKLGTDPNAGFTAWQGI
jgi:hypothetical protein